MKQNLTPTITSLLSILLMTFHMTHDTLRAKAGSAEAGGLTFILVPILVVWLYGTLLLAERRSGHIIMLVGSLLALLMVVIHTKGPGDVVSGEFAKSAEAFFFVWTLMALGVTGMFRHPLGARAVEPPTEQLLKLIVGKPESFRPRVKRLLAELAERNC